MCYCRAGNSEQFATLLGLEFSGYDASGGRVMGLLPAEGLATHVTTDPKFTWNIPERWYHRVFAYCLMSSHT